MALKQASNPSFKALSEGLMIEILTRLPVKSLLRMKSVSKTWYNLINSPYFVTMHANLAKKDKLIIYAISVIAEDEASHVFSFRSNNRPMVLLSPDLQLPAKHEICNIVGSCNGIVCFINSHNIFLCNPATRELKQLPPPTSFHPISYLKPNGHVINAVGFCSSSIYGLKVIIIYVVLSSRDSHTVEVYNLSSNTWRQLDWVGKEMSIYYNRGSIFCRDSCHWVSRYHDGHESILCFDMLTESFKTIGYPQAGFNWKNGNSRLVNVFVSRLKERLSLITIWGFKKQYIDIWIMKEYGVEDSWTKLYTFGPFSSHLYPLSFWMDANALLLKNSGVNSFHAILIMEM